VNKYGDGHMMYTNDVVFKKYGGLPNFGRPYGAGYYFEWAPFFNFFKPKFKFELALSAILKLNLSFKSTIFQYG